VLGIELFGLGAGDWSQASLDTSNTLVLPSFLENTQVGRVGGGLGGGLRLSTPGKSVRLSAGAGAGVMFRHVYTNLSVIDGTRTGYASPLLLTDVSLLFGKTLSLGIVAWVEFSRDITVAAQLGDFLPGATELPITLFSGPQFFLGPTIALHFGQ
ncbi:MAG: hypothetical protein MK135_15900, partial [Polyangiaceae bacterium]|nr:hypothetical protein [Polyangiaceae bacterium]